jgi:hypothetical protein
MNMLPLNSNIQFYKGIELNQKYHTKETLSIWYVSLKRINKQDDHA